MAQPRASTLPLPPPQPEVCISSIGSAISVRWSTGGFPAASYVLELREASSSVSNRFACQAPADGAASLELCIQGLQPGQSYTACVRGVTQDGFEGVPSPWSNWVTLPMLSQPYVPWVCSPASMPPQHMNQQPPPLMPPLEPPHMPSPVFAIPTHVPPLVPAAPATPAPTPQAAKQQPLSPSQYSILFDEVPVEKTEKNNFGMSKACPPPEITGHEDALFLD